MDTKILKGKFQTFGEYFVENFEIYIASCLTLLEDDSQKSYIEFGTNVLEALLDSPNAVIKEVFKQSKRKVGDHFRKIHVGKFTEVAYKLKDSEKWKPIRKELCKAALTLTESFRFAFTNATKEFGGEQRALQILARAAIWNFINWYESQSNVVPISEKIVLQGVTTKISTYKSRMNVFRQPTSTMNDKNTSKTYNPVKLFTMSDVRVNDVKEYRKDPKQPSKYGFRFVFPYELENIEKLFKGYNEIAVTKDSHMSVKLLRKDLYKDLLNDINNKDRTLMESRLKKHMEDTTKTIAQKILLDTINEIQTVFKKLTSDITAVLPEVASNSSSQGTTVINQSAEKSTAIANNNIPVFTLNVN